MPIDRNRYKFKVDDKVKYRREWLQSIGVSWGAIALARGIIIQLIPLGETTLAEIDWDYASIPKRVNCANLALANDPETV